MSKKTDPNLMVRDDNDLYKILDHVKGHLDGIRSEYEEIKTKDADTAARLEAAEASWKDIEARLEKMDKLLPRGNKHYISAGGDAKAQDNQETRERFARWLINNMAHTLQGSPRFGDDGYMERFDGVQADISQTVADDTEGGYLVPDEFRQEIIRIQETYGFARANFRRIPVQRETLHMPTHVSGPAVTWVDEGEGPDDTKATFGRLTLTTKRLMAVDTLSMEVADWSIPLITNFLIDVFAEKIAQEEDRVALLGDSQSGASTTDPFDGVLTDAGNVVTMGTGRDAFEDITYEDLVDLIDAPNVFVANRGVIVLHNHIVNLIRKIRSDSGAGAGTGLPMWVDMASGRPGTILGRPYIISPAMPGKAQSAASTKFIAYGDWSRAFLADSWRTRVDFSAHADFKKGNIVMRVLERVGFKVAIADAFAVLRTAA